MSLREEYGGIPDGGGLKATGYEVELQHYAEAAHCVLGSLNRMEMQPYDIGLSFQFNAPHIEEEITIMEKDLFRPSRAGGDAGTQERGKRLAAIARSKKSSIGKTKDPHMKKLAEATYDALIILGEGAGDNSLRDMRLHAATRKVRNIWEEFKNSMRGKYQKARIIRKTTMLDRAQKLVLNKRRRNRDD